MRLYSIFNDWIHDLSYVADKSTKDSEKIYAREATNSIGFIDFTPILDCSVFAARMPIKNKSSLTKKKKNTII